jgi:hypothetical protein
MLFAIITLGYNDWKSNTSTGSTKICFGGSYKYALKSNGDCFEVFSILEERSRKSSLSVARDKHASILYWVLVSSTLWLCSSGLSRTASRFLSESIPSSVFSGVETASEF